MVEQIKDLFDAEHQLVKALPKLAQSATTPQLADALNSHLEETRAHVSRLEQVFTFLEEKPKGKKCKAMQGLLAEGDEAAKDEKKGDLRDLAIIAGGQRVEHYEISAYGTAKAMAERLGLDKVVTLLRKTEEEESTADAKLTQVAGEIYDTVGDESEGASRPSARKMAQSASAGSARRRAAR